MIVVKLMGGLGNQMFQYAAARSLSLKKKTNLYLDHSFFDTASTGVTYRKYELTAFNLIVNQANSFQLFPFLLIKKYPSLKHLLSFTYVKEPYIKYIPDILKKYKNIYLDGYWQSEKYFAEKEQTIRKDFEFKNSFTEANHECAKKIKNCNAVAVHIRRSDYITNPQINSTHGTCTIEYYTNAINLLKSKFQNLNFFFFSDDMDWTTLHFVSIENSFFVNHNKNEDSFHDMHLMSLCNHFIIANSSFSWWAAWLGLDNEKVVIAPSKWFITNEHNTKDLLPKGWIKL